ncbi:beta-1,3-galactosyltransferase 5-like [Drosophila guanche]|uniref:Hexosyltransferase n=1 Tax=Drosophila guanche TaxID=7266 RepID=A0A3B0KAJ7_DROGU|nr:beta-1,3-galactosyltransferase 5-like [Drosophila guanche]SPP82061.1 blast:Beta-1%2C3-galactosyltransferase 5 [Drosophila guanche]
MSIRQTWMHYASRRDVGMAFVLGRSEDWKLNKALNKENYMYGDMIRGHFIDSYFNLTLKTISSLEWVDAHCPHAKYILKTDDDMFINVPRLLEFIDGHKDKRTIYGRVVDGQQSDRSSEPKFPKYATGVAYLLTGDVVHELYMQSLSSSYFPQEDIFITGIMAERLNITSATRLASTKSSHTNSTNFGGYF